MEELKNLLEVVSLVGGLLGTILALKGNSPYRQIIIRTFLEAVFFTGLIVFFDLYNNQQVSIFDSKTLNNYVIIFLTIFLILICSDLILYRVGIFFKDSKKLARVFVGSLIIFFLGVILIVDNSDSNIEFLEDTPAQFVDSNGREYEILIPKSTTIVWNKGSIINMKNEIMEPNDMLVFHGEENKIIFKKSKELKIKANTIIYLNSPKNANECKTEDTNNTYNLDFLNKNYNDIQFVLETNFKLEKDVDISLTQDTLVKIYKKLDKPFIICLSFLFCVSLSFNFIFFYKNTNETDDTNESKNT